jgi:hypothetical protein
MLIWALTFILLPIWRNSTHPGEGRNLIQYWEDTAYNHVAHISYEEAVQRSQEAYRCYQINRRS